MLVFWREGDKGGRSRNFDGSGWYEKSSFTIFDGFHEGIPPSGILNLAKISRQTFGRQLFPLDLSFIKM